MLSHEALISHLPGDTENERLEVVLQVGAGDPRLLLKQQTFGPGIGWYTQSAIALTLNQLRGLQQSLCIAKSLNASSTVESGVDDDQPVLIPFPGQAVRN